MTPSDISLGIISKISMGIYLEVSLENAQPITGGNIVRTHEGISKQISGALPDRDSKEKF